MNLTLDEINIICGIFIFIMIMLFIYVFYRERHVFNIEFEKISDITWLKDNKD